MWPGGVWCDLVGMVWSGGIWCGGVGSGGVGCGVWCGVWCGGVGYGGYRCVWVGWGVTECPIGYSIRGSYTHRHTHATTTTHTPHTQKVLF